MRSLKEEHGQLTHENNVPSELETQPFARIFNLACYRGCKRNRHLSFLNPLGRSWRIKGCLLSHRQQGKARESPKTCVNSWSALPIFLHMEGSGVLLHWGAFTSSFIRIAWIWWYLMLILTLKFVICWFTAVSSSSSSLVILFIINLKCFLCLRNGLEADLKICRVCCTCTNRIS